MIFLANCPAKLADKAQLGPVYDALGTLAAETMCGGIDRRGTDFACHILREFGLLARRLGRSAACVFIDARDAFYSLIHEAFLGARLRAKC